MFVCLIFFELILSNDLKFELYLFYAFSSFRFDDRRNQKVEVCHLRNAYGKPSVLFALTAWHDFTQLPRNNRPVSIFYRRFCLFFTGGSVCFFTFLFCKNIEVFVRVFRLFDFLNSKLKTHSGLLSFCKAAGSLPLLEIFCLIAL